MALYLQALPSLLIIRGLTFYRFRLFQGLWRYTSLWDLRNILIGVGASSVLFYVVVHWIMRRAGVSAVGLPDRCAAARLPDGRRAARAPHRVPRCCRRPRARRVLVIGAGDAGEMIVREMTAASAIRLRAGRLRRGRSAMARPAHPRRAGARRHARSRRGSCSPSTRTKC